MEVERLRSVTSHLSHQHVEFVESADCLLGFGGQDFLVHSQLLSYHSQHLATVFRISLPNGACEEGLHHVPLQPGALPPAITALTCKQFGLWLRHIYEPQAAVAQALLLIYRLQQRRIVGLLLVNLHLLSYQGYYQLGCRLVLVFLELEEAAVLLLLSDYFQTPSVTSKVEAWMCSRLRFISTQPGLETLGCLAFELATHYRLVQATAHLLPWVLERLSAGGRQGVVWYDSWRLNQRLHAALSKELKALCFDVATWWSSMPLGASCSCCGCLASDLSPAFDKKQCYCRYHCQGLQGPLQQNNPMRYYSFGGVVGPASQQLAGLALQHHGPHHHHQQQQQQQAPQQAQQGAPIGEARPPGGVASPGSVPRVPAAARTVSCCPYQRAAAHFAHSLLEGGWGARPPMLQPGV